MEKIEWHSWEEEPKVGRMIVIKSAFNNKAFVGVATKTPSNNSKGYSCNIQEDPIFNIDGKFVKEWCYYDRKADYNELQLEFLSRSEKKEYSYYHSCHRNNIDEMRDKLVSRMCRGIRL